MSDFIGTPSGNKMSGLAFFSSASIELSKCQAMSDLQYLDRLGSFAVPSPVNSAALILDRKSFIRKERTT
jgi:hypothetical protein